MAGFGEIILRTIVAGIHWQALRQLPKNQKSVIIEQFSKAVAYIFIPARKLSGFS